METSELDTHPDSSASSPNSTSGAAATTKAVKDRQCPFCGQPFTSSSLGRHLDLYIKSKNPKPPDGIHDVDEIRRIRGGITRRQPKTNSKAASAHHSDTPHDRVEASGSASNSASQNHQVASSVSHESPSTPATGTKEVDEGKIPWSKMPWNKANWQATGVINDLPPRIPSRENTETSTGQSGRLNEMRQDARGNKIKRPEFESESMWKLEEAAELGRAAEMALREVLGSLEAAQKKAEPRTVFDDFDFFELSFPGLCLAILPPPSTLFSPTPFPSAESWTLGPPGLRQFEAINRYLNERVMVRRRQVDIPDSVAFRHHSHLGAAWEHWQTLSENERTSAWNLQILRSYTRANERNTQLRAELETSRQHSRHLEAQYDRLSRCQLPREYLMHPPNTVPIPPSVLRHVDPSQFKSGVAEVDYDADILISKWKTTIKTTARSSRATHSLSQPIPQAPKYMYNDNQVSHLNDDMVMQGSIFGVNGPMPRSDDLHNEQPTSHTNISYETPPEPGIVVAADDDDPSPRADGHSELDHETERYGSRSGQNDAVARRPRFDHSHNMNSGSVNINGLLNVNGKRPLAPTTSHAGYENKVYKAQSAD